MQIDSSINVWFTGFMATGKSRVGSIVASRLGRRFVDTDKVIEERLGQSVTDYFTQHGEAAFRAIELSVVKELALEKGIVISLGGGSLTIPEVPSIVKNSGLLVRLWASSKVLSERISRKHSRPLLANLEPSDRLAKIEEMLEQREVFYSNADFAIESTDSSSVEHVAERVLAGLRVWSKRAVEVKTSAGERYPIFIGRSWLNDLDAILEGLRLAPGNAFLAVTDANLRSRQSHNLRTITDLAGNCQVFTFPPGESQKSLQILNRLYTFMLRRNFGRKTCLLQFGGGVVGDMAGFGAATYQRGIPFVQIPTTLLSMVDSSVGGKVAVNHPEGKNMIGSFYQPKAVVIDLNVLETLPKSEFQAGLAEIVKYGVIYDAAFFAYLETHVDAISQKDPQVLSYIIRRSCEIKAIIVGMDEKETGIRAILNYGHTFGHAIEKLTNYETFSHGIAVGLGMRVAGRLSTLLGRWSANDENRQNALLEKMGIPSRFTVNPMDAWNAMGIDKKVEKAKRVYILPKSIGFVGKYADAPEDLVHQAWSAIQDEVP